MNFFGDWLFLILCLAAVGGLALVGLLTKGRHKAISRGDVNQIPQSALETTTTDAAGKTDLATPETITPTQVQKPEAPSFDRPENMASRMVRLRQRLSRSHGAFGRGLLALLSKDRIDEATWEDIEDTLISADIGVRPTQEMVDKLRLRLRVGGENTSSPHTVLREELLELIDPTMDRRLAASGADGLPGVVLVVGVNGAGKTTTVGKIARILVAEGRSVMLGAADTFRAAAVEQLSTWGARVGVEVIRGSEGTDPASVAFDAVKQGIDQGVDTVLIDTAGRLQNKQGLMDELGKVKRVIEKQTQVTEVLLVLDATTGQNGMIQARVFSEAVNVTGIVLTKLDGSAKGGIVVAVQRELGVPVKLVGLGEGQDDLAPFDPEVFADALLG
jgi:fused signal recognition particle receptor